MKVRKDAEIPRFASQIPVNREAIPNPGISWDKSSSRERIMCACTVGSDFIGVAPYGEKKNEMKLVTTPIFLGAQRKACSRCCADGPAMWGNYAP